MKKIALFLALAFMVATAQAQTYNTLWIPDTLSGTNFTLTARDTFKQMVSGNQTITAAYNGNFWGPTMIWNKGDVVHLTVNNQLQDTTTVHWHGMHLPAIMDGGPHQTIPPYTTWSPYWKVDNNAATYWYHPHLHMDAEKQLTQGLGGLIIVRDSIESALALPRTYGVDDIPVILTDRSFDASKQFTVVPYGDSMVTNGVLRAQYTVPAQIVRFRILNAAIERSYNIGFSDNRTFYIITTDGGLLNKPVTATRYLISPGERVEILVNFNGQSGSNLNMKAFNSTLSNFIAGGEIFPGGPFANALGKIDFNVLHINVGTATSNAITTIPSALTTNVFPTATSANITRVVTMSDSAGVSGILGPNAFILNHHLFGLNTVDYSVPLNNTEIWQLTSSSLFAHPFHIHDVEFHILSRNGVAPDSTEDGWKDVVLVKGGETVKFIAKFSDYADSLHPYMFHCHIALHEDEGMMGQFVVGNAPTGIMNVAQNSKLKIYPNPVKGMLHYEIADGKSISKAYILNVTGQVVLTFDMEGKSPQLDISSLDGGMYFVRLLDTDGGMYIKSYLKE
jgi:blue copper oxidase